MPATPRLPKKPETVNFPRPDLKQALNNAPGPVRTTAVAQEVPVLGSKAGGEVTNNAFRTFINDVIRKADSQGILEGARKGVEGITKKVSASGKPLNEMARTMAKRGGQTALGGAAARLLGPAGMGLTGYDLGGAIYDKFGPDISSVIDKLTGLDDGAPAQTHYAPPPGPTMQSLFGPQQLSARPADGNDLPIAEPNFAKADPHAAYEGIVQGLTAHGVDPSMIPSLAASILIDARLGRDNMEAGVARAAQGQAQMPNVQKLFGP